MNQENPYIILLKHKLHEQETVYQAFKKNECPSVLYKGVRHKKYGLKDENYINRLRLSYYLFYEKIDDEAVIASLFEEELTDRQNNSFQGIGLTLPILTQLLQNYNADARYDLLFAKAKEANFDCACGYDAHARTDDTLENNSLLDCIFLAQDLNYIDICEKLVAMWKQQVTDWNTENLRTLLGFNSFLNREAENEELYKQLLTNATAATPRKDSYAQAKSGKIFDIASAYQNIIRYYIDTENYTNACRYLNQLLTAYQLDEIRPLRLYSSLMECGLEIMVHEPASRNVLWAWLKPQLQHQKDMFGNLYTKAIAAAESAGDPYAETLKAKYINWQKKVYGGIPCP